MNSDLISIIVPAYNIEKFVERCLESISAQTYQDLEIIVVDDGSTDSTAEVIDQYRKKDDRVIAIHKQNGGVSTARSAGLAIATGEYIGFVDGDDYIEPQMFERLLTNMRKYGADISHCGYKMIFPDGHEDEHHRIVRHAFRRIGYIAHTDAELLRCLQVHMVISDRPGRDHFHSQLMESFHQLRVDL